MTRIVFTAAALSFCFMTALVNAEPQANAPADMKLTDDQCVMIWKQAHAADKAPAETEMLSLDAVRPFLKDVAKADVDRDKLISTGEWADACKAGLVMSAPEIPADKTPDAR